MATCVIDVGREWIECLRCGLRSYNPNDVEQRYCGHCHIFHDDVGKSREEEIWESWLKRIMHIKTDPGPPETYEIDLECGHHVCMMIWPWSNKLPCAECLNARIQTDPDEHARDAAGLD